jgi:malate dehydrogenase
MKITLIGAAGNVGSAAAFNIALHNITDELVMVDEYSKDKLEQYVADLSTAVSGLDTRVRAGNYADMEGSDIVLMAAGSAQVVASRMEVLPQNLPIIKDLADKIKIYCPQAIVITATNPIDPLNYEMYLATGMDRKKVLGYSANDSLRFRMYLAEALGEKASRVEATAIGEHGASQVLLYSLVKVNGKPITVSAEAKQHVRQQEANLPNILEGQRIKTGRTHAWTTSMGLAALCNAISKDTGEMTPCSVVLNGEYGLKEMSMSVPALIGKEGVHKVLEWKLDAEEQAGLANTIKVLKPAMKTVEEFLGQK